MTELSDWIWLAVAMLWVAAQVLPRLFRRQRRSTQSPAAPARSTKRSEGQAPQAAEAPAYTQVGRERFRGSSTAGFPEQGRSGKPIEPR